MTSENHRTHVVSEQAVSAWVRLVRAQTRVLDEIQGALKAAGLPALSWYDVLYELYKAGNDGLRQFELGGKTLITKYNLSRMIKKMRQEGVVEIIDCPEDGRGKVVTITGKGVEILKNMWPIYGAVIRDRIENNLSPSELRDVQLLLGKTEK